MLQGRRLALRVSGLPHFWPSLQAFRSVQASEGVPLSLRTKASAAVAVHRIRGYQIEQRPKVTSSRILTQRCAQSLRRARSREVPGSV